jgi:hypothetical protein
MTAFPSSTAPAPPRAQWSQSMASSAPACQSAYCFLSKMKEYFSCVCVCVCVCVCGKCLHTFEIEMTKKKWFQTSRAFFLMTSISEFVSVENYKKQKTFEYLWWWWWWWWWWWEKSIFILSKRSQNRKKNVLYSIYGNNHTHSKFLAVTNVDLHVGWSCFDKRYIFFNVLTWQRNTRIYRRTSSFKCVIFLFDFQILLIELLFEKIVSGWLPCNLSALTVVTRTAQCGSKPLYRHLISKNFSAPISAPNPAWIPNIIHFVKIVKFEFASLSKDRFWDMYFSNDKSVRTHQLQCNLIGNNRTIAYRNYVNHSLKQTSLQ